MREATTVRQVPTSSEPHPDPVDEVGGSPAGLPVAVVARRLGVAPATLRTWDRRYGLGPSQHRPGAHRRYAARDLARLEEMSRLLRAGWAPADAARAAQEVDPAPVTQRAPQGGGQVLALPDADAATRGLGRAALALDAETARRLVGEELVGRGLLSAWDDVLRPVLVAVGQRWAETGEGVEVEHLLAECVVRALQEWSATHPPPAPRRPVLLAGAPGEQHALPLHAVSAGLSERGVACRLLGPDLPSDALAAAVRRTGPSVLFVWAQRRPTAQAVRAAALPVQRPPTALVVGGPGWGDGPLPSGATAVESLGEALDEVVARAT